MYLILEPEGKRIRFRAGATLQEILAEHNLFFAHPCGGRATCGHCRALFKEHAPEPTAPEKKWLTEEQLALGLRLSCCTHPVDGSIISLVGAEQTKFVFALGDDTHSPITINPLVKKITLDLELPTLEKQGDYLERVLEQLHLNEVEFEQPIPDVPVGVLEQLPDAVQKHQGLVTATCNARRIIEIEPGDTREEFLGVAIDIGTTSVAARLIDLNTGSILAQAATLNSQSNLGVDVINRIEYCHHTLNGLQILQEKILADLQSLTATLLQQSGTDPESIAQVTLVGNPTMTHLLLGVDPRSIAVSPYTPVWTRMVHLPARELILLLSSGCEAVVGPAVSGYVGSDVLGGVIACGMDQTDELTLLVDVGTNGEMVLGNRERMFAAASPAGPAFEGAQISCGTWAAPGAIDHVIINETVDLHTLEDLPPIGLCGSGLLDVTAELLRLGLVTPMGRMKSKEQLGAIPDFLLEHMHEINQQPAFFLADSQFGPLHLTAQDIRQVQLAKGALQSGIAILMKEMGVTADDIKQIYLAGAFGQKIIKSNLRRLGLLQEMDEGRIRSVGNSALAGAQLMLVSREHLKRLEQLKKQIRYIELSGYPGYMDTFADALQFPQGEEKG